MSEQTIGRYKVLERVGRGGMGVLYRGVDPVLDREVAIKVMAGDFSESDEAARSRFFREARAAARLQHRNIVTVFEFADEGGVPYIVMEFLRGQNLASRMVIEPALTFDEILDIASQLCTGLQFAHDNGVVHRDVKPANVWLLADRTVKLLDFGIAKVSASTVTRHGDVLGSACYMAPEQLAGGAVDGRADIFSAGVVLYEMLAHRKPFDAESPTAVLLQIMQEEPEPIDRLVPGLPAALGAAVERALKKNADERYQTAGDFGADLDLIRMTLQSSGDTVFGADFDLGDTVVVPGPVMQRASAPASASASAIRPADVVAAPASEPAVVQTTPKRRLIAVTVLASLLLLVIVGWLALRRSGPSAPVATTPAAATTASGGSREPAALPAAVESAGRRQSAAGAPVASGPQPASGRGNGNVLRVTSDPPGAAIALDDRPTGLTTPADVPIEGAAPTRLRLTRNGYKMLEARLSARAMKEGTVRYELQPSESATIEVSITGSYPFEVFDGKRQISASATSHQVSVAASHVLRLRADTYLLDHPVEVAGPGPMQVTAPELGSVSFRSTLETCKVWLDGRDVGYPNADTQLVAAGTHTMQLRCPDPGGRVIRASISVVGGQSNRFDVLPDGQVIRR